MFTSSDQLFLSQNPQVMKIHDTNMTIQPESPLKPPPSVENTAGQATIPTQFWAASQFSKMQSIPQGYESEQLLTLQNQYKLQEQKQQVVQRKEVEQRVTHEEALKGRGYLAKKEYDDKVAAENLPQSAVFKTYGRDTLSYQQKIQILPKSEFIYDPKFEQVDERMSVAQLDPNLAYLTEQAREDPEAVKQSLISKHRFKEIEKVDYPDYTDGIEQNTSLKGEHDKKMARDPAPSAAFSSPNRDMYPPNILRYTANETTLDQYDPFGKRTQIGKEREEAIRKQEDKLRSPYGQMKPKQKVAGAIITDFGKDTPLKTSPRRLANQNCEAKDNLPYEINQQQYANATRHTIHTAGQEVRSPLKSQVIGPPRIHTQERQQKEGWYGNKNQVQHLKHYQQRREQLSTAAEFQNDINDNEQDDNVDQDVFINQKEINYVQKRIGSPWKQWALPEHQEQPIDEQRKIVDGYAELQKKREDDLKRKKKVEDDEQKLKKELTEQEQFDKQKQNKSYSPNYKNIRVNNVKQGLNNRPAFNNAPQYMVNRPDLLTENKYLNEGVPRPLNMKTVAKLRHMHVTNGNGQLRTEYKDEEAQEYVQALQQEQTNKRNYIDEKSAAFSGYSKERSNSPQRTNRLSFSPIQYYPTALSPNSRSNARPVVAPNMKNQNFSRQTSRDEAFRERNAVALMPTEALSPGRYMDKDIMAADNAKNQYVNEMAQAFRYPNGQVVEKGVTKQLVETMANKMQMMTAMTENGEQATIQCLRENQIVKPKTTVKDLQRSDNKAFIEFRKQFPRGEMEVSGKRNAVAIYNENIVRLRQEKENYDYKLKNKLLEPEPQLTIAQKQHLYTQALEQQKKQDGLISTNRKGLVPSVANYGREVLATRASAEGATNITVPLATQLQLDEDGKLHMPRSNQNFFDYQDQINCVDQYKKLHSAERIATDLGHTYQNTMHKFSAYEMKQSNDAPFYIADLHNNHKILGSFEQQSNRQTAGHANKVVQSQNHQVNDLVYKRIFTQTEPRVSGVVDLGKQLPKK